MSHTTLLQTNTASQESILSTLDYLKALLVELEELDDFDYESIVNHNQGQLEIAGELYWPGEVLRRMACYDDNGQIDGYEITRRRESYVEIKSIAIQERIDLLESDLVIF